MKYLLNKTIFVSTYTVIATLFLIISGVSYSSALQLINALTMVSHTQEVIKDLNQLEYLIEENENLILSDVLPSKSYIDNAEYILNQNLVIQQIRKVQKLTDDNIVQQRKIAEIEEVFSNIFVDIESRIKLNQQEIREKSKIIKAGKIEKLQLVDNLIQGMNNEESKLLVERSNNAEKQIINTIIVISFSSLSGLGFIIFTGLLLYRNLKKQQQDNLTIIEQKELLQTIFNNIPIMIVLGDKNGKINLTNREWEKVLSESIKDIGAETEYYKQICNQINSLENNTWIDFQISLKDGRVIDTSWAKVDLSNGQTLAIGQDISKQKQSEKLEKLLFDSSQAIVAAPSLEKALEMAISHICQTIEGNFAEAWIVKENSQYLELCPHFYSSKPELNSFFQSSKNFKLSFGQDIPGRVWASKATEWVSPLTQQPASVFLRCELAGLVELETALGIPVLLENQVIAIFVFYWSEARSFDRKTVEIANYLINQLALMLQRRLMEKRTKELNEHLEERTEERTEELVASKEQLAKAKAKADHANQAKSLFLANMSHELRTPLNGILGYTEILQNSSALPEQEKNQVKTIYNCGHHLLMLLNDILDLSKIEAGKMELNLHEFNFPLFLQNVVEMFQIRAKLKNIDFICVTDKNLPTRVCGDEKRLGQVLINLLSNAIKFTKEGTVTFTITETFQEFENSKADANGCQMKKTIKFEICDTGVGMTPEQLESIFQAFTQVGDTTQQEEGTGLGLAISQQIIKLMDSEIHVESGEGIGSIFWFEVNLPIVEKLSRVEEIGDRSSKIIGIQGSAPKVLVVDDAPENISLIVYLLEPIGFQVMTAVNGQDGLEKFESFQPDLVITDLAMPIMDGYDLMGKIRHLYPSRKVKIIAASASVFDKDYQTSMESGADDFIPKPINTKNLFNKLKEHLNLEWVYQQEKPDNYEQEKQCELVIPPETDLKILLDFASKGSIKSIIKYAEYLQKINRKFVPFTEQVIELANDFQDAKIIELISSYMSNIMAG